ncbi:ribose 5-phosphate isomerase A, partial [Pantoea ananatis]
IEQVAAFEAKLNNIVGVVCNGLFSAQRADILLMATADGVKKLTAK